MMWCSRSTLNLQPVATNSKSRSISRSTPQLQPVKAHHLLLITITPKACSKSQQDRTKYTWKSHLLAMIFLHLGQIQMGTDVTLGIKKTQRSAMITILMPPLVKTATMVRQILMDIHVPYTIPIHFFVGCLITPTSTQTPCAARAVVESQ